MNDFHSQLIYLLDSAQIERGEGDSVMLFAKQFPNLKSSLIVYMDSEAKQLAFARRYLYLPSFSGEDRLLFADITLTVKQFSHYVEVYGYEKTIEGTTLPVVLEKIEGRSIQNIRGNYGALFNDLVKDLKPLFSEVDISIPLQSLGKVAHIEIGKRDKFYSAGIFVVPEVNDLHISKYNALAVNYAKIDRNCLGVITDGYDFIVFKEQHNIGYVEENKMDYTHFVGTLVSYLRFVL